MNRKVIVLSLLCIVTASQPAFTAVQDKSADDEPPHVTMASTSADIARTPVVRTYATPSPAEETALVAVPFSSLELSPSLVEYLGLTVTQVTSIQKLMDQERPTTEPLMHELRTISGELGAAIQHSQNNKNEGSSEKRRLAARQALLLKQLMRANSRLQRKINAVLDLQQRRKLDSFKRTSEVTLGEGN